MASVLCYRFGFVKIQNTLETWHLAPLRYTPKTKRSSKGMCIIRHCSMMSNDLQNGETKAFRSAGPQVRLIMDSAFKLEIGRAQKKELIHTESSVISQSLDSIHCLSYIILHVSVTLACSVADIVVNGKVIKRNEVRQLCVSPINYSMATTPPAWTLFGGTRLGVLRGCCCYHERRSMLHA